LNLPWDSAAAKSYAAIRSVLEWGGDPVGNLDMMIAAQALAAPAALVTHDHAFRRVRNLKVENWTKAP
jgi:tRNA(fMet)-specific endonuclease VapC